MNLINLVRMLRNLSSSNCDKSTNSKFNTWSKVFIGLFFTQIALLKFNKSNFIDLKTNAINTRIFSNFVFNNFSTFLPLMALFTIQSFFTTIFMQAQLGLIFKSSLFKICIDLSSISWRLETPRIIETEFRILVFNQSNSWDFKTFYNT